MSTISASVAGNLPYSAVRTVQAEDISSEELMLAYAQGDASAFRKLFKRYAPVILGLGHRHLRDEAAAQDLVQKTFMRLHGARNDFQRGRDLHPFLLTITMNLIRDEWRSRKRKPTAPLDVENVEPAANHEPDAGQDTVLVEQQRAQALRNALQQLPDMDRLIIELHWFQERAFPEVAQILGLSHGAVRVRAHRASSKLRLILTQEPNQV